MENRFEPIIAARLFVEKHFPDCQAALLAGSVVREEATEMSDLDIVIFDEVVSSYRESLIEFSWPIEVIQLAERILQPYGGRLFDGFSIGKK